MPKQLFIISMHQHNVYCPQMIKVALNFNLKPRGRLSTSFCNLKEALFICINKKKIQDLLNQHFRRQLDPIYINITNLMITSPIKTFGLLLLGLEVIILIFYGAFVRMLVTLPGDVLAAERYGAFQDTNVMMLIGFGFLMTFIKTHALSALTYTFFINAVVMQLYVLFNGFWVRILQGFSNFDYYLTIQQLTLTNSSYCVASILIAFGGFIGRVGPKELLIAAVIQAFGYSFNEVINLTQIQTFDAGGSTTIHAFGAYYGLAVSWMLSKKNPPHSKAEANYNSNTIAMIGTLFLWIYWPSFNFGAYANNYYEQNQIVTNTIYSLIGSCVSTFMMSALLGKKLVMEDILNATLAGGVIIGASSGFLYHPSVALAIGIVGGIVSTLCYHYLAPLLQQKIKLYDTCGIHCLHGIPGLLGGIFSAIIMASYNNGFDSRISAAMSRANNPVLSRHGTYLNQGGLQLAGTFTSVGFGIAFGIVAGFILNQFYNENSDNFFEDKVYINLEESGHDSESGSRPAHEIDENKQRLIDS